MCHCVTVSFLLSAKADCAAPTSQRRTGSRGVTHRTAAHVAKPEVSCLCDPVAAEAVLLLSSERSGFLPYQHSGADQGTNYITEVSKYKPTILCKQNRQHRTAVK